MASPEQIRALIEKGEQEAANKFYQALKVSILPLLDAVKSKQIPLLEADITADMLGKYIDNTKLEATLREVITQNGSDSYRLREDEFKSWAPTMVIKADRDPNFYQRVMAVYLELFGGMKIQELANTSMRWAHVRLVNILQAGVEAELGIYQLEQLVLTQLAEDWDTLSRWRAEMIARTEVVGAQNFGAIQAAKATGLPLKKEWLAELDNRTRDTHINANGTKVALDGKFTIGAALLSHPADPASNDPAEVVNCRCTLLFTKQ